MSRASAIQQQGVRTVLRRLLPVATAALLIATLVPVTAGPVAATDLAAPILLQPAPGASVNDTGVHFRWTRVSGAVSYRLHVWSVAEGEGFDLVETTANDDFVAFASIPTALLNWSVTSIDAQGNDGQTAASTFAPADPAPALLGPVDGTVVTYPDAGPQLRAWSRQAPPYYYFYDTDVAGQGDPMPDLGGTSAEPRLEPGTYRWTAGYPDQHHDHPVAAPVRTLTVEWPEATPQLLEPADGASVVAGDTAVLRWGSVPGAVAYEVQFDRGSGFDGQPVIGTPIPAFVLSDLWTAQTLRWRVRPTQTPAGFLWPVRGPWSEARTITVSAQGEITGLSPVDGAAVASWPVFRWDPLANASAYEVQFAIDPVTGPTQSRVINTPAFTLKANGDWLAQLAAGETWWRVRAVPVLSVGIASEWSSWRHVTVESADGVLGAPVAATGIGAAACPEGDACEPLTGWPILRWEPVRGAALYRVFLRHPLTASAYGYVDVAGAELVAGPLASQASDPGTSRALWSVVACPSLVDCPTEPVGAVYRVERSLPAPIPVNPGDDATVYHAGQVLTWLPVPSDLASGPDEVLPALTTCLETARTRDGGSTTTATRCSTATSTIVDLTDDAGVVEWRVRAEAGTTFLAEPGAWSARRSFRHAPPTPVLDSPVEGATVTGAPVLRWHAAPSEVQYGVDVIREDVHDAFGWNLAMRYGPGGATSIQTTTPLAPGAYLWRVTSGDNVATVGHFTVEGTTELPLIEPAAGAIVPADDVDLSWTEVPWARFYTVAIGSTPDFWGIDAVWWGTSPLPSLAVPVRLPEGPLYWRVCPMLDGLNASDCSATNQLAVGASEVRAMTVTSALSARDLAIPTSHGLLVQLRLNATMSSTGRVPLRVRWTSSDVGSGVDAQEIQVKQDDGSWQPAASGRLTGTASYLDLNLAAGHRYDLRVRATDLAGNIGDWASARISLRLRQETSSAWRWSGSWSRVRSTAASGGAFRRSTDRGATAKMTFTARSVALIAPRSTSRGKAEVWIDGTKATTIRLNANPTGARRVVFTRSWGSAGSHRIKVVVLGAPAGSRVDLDAIVLVE